MTQKLINDVILMFPEARKKYIKNLSSKDREQIASILGLPKNISQKKLCLEFEKIADFIAKA